MEIRGILGFQRMLMSFAVNMENFGISTYVSATYKPVNVIIMLHEGPY